MGRVSKSNTVQHRLRFVHLFLFVFVTELLSWAVAPTCAVLPPNLNNLPGACNRFTRESDPSILCFCSFYRRPPRPTSVLNLKGARFVHLYARFFSFSSLSLISCIGSLLSLYFARLLFLPFLCWQPQSHAVHAFNRARKLSSAQLFTIVLQHFNGVFIVNCPSRPIVS